MNVATLPKCRFCGREFRQGEWWSWANMCRASHLLPIIVDNPGLSAWELSQVSGLNYQDTSKGLQKARDGGLVTTEAEDREAGGIRYRYWPADGWQEKVAEWRSRGFI